MAAASERSMRARPTFSLLVLAGALALSLGAAATVHVVEQNNAKAEFEADAREQHQRIEARIDALVALLRGGAGLLGSPATVTDEVFRNYVARLNLRRNYPGVLGLGFARRVQVEDLPAFEDEARDAFPGFNVYPVPIETSDTWVIRMLEPLDERNIVAIGFDMGSQPTRRAAMEQAAASGKPALSGRVTLVQEITADKQAGFLVYVPVYEGTPVPDTPEGRQARTLGVSYSPLRAGDFFAPLVARDRPHFEVYAAPQAQPEALLFRSAPTERDDWHLSLPLTAPAPGWLVRYSQPHTGASGSALTVAALGVLLSFGLYFATAAAERRAREQNLLNAQEAAVARALAYLSASPTEPGAMVERLADWLIAEELATGVEALRDHRPVLRRGAPVEGEPIEHPLAGMTLRIAPSAAASLGAIARVLEQGGWLVERAALLEQARQALARNEAALKFADVFVGVLGHDLRNPLNAISTAAQLLQRLDPGPREAEVLRRLRASTDRMARLIDQILDFTRARIGGGIPIRPRPADLAVLVGDIAAETSTAAPDREIVSRIDGQTQASVDPDRFAQALSNLLGNAIQHGETGPVEVEVDGRDADAVQITVRNRGVVPPEILPSVFEPFRSGTGSEARLGLGMYIARMIVEAHDGTIAMDSAPESGTQVRIRLPRA